MENNEFDYENNNDVVEVTDNGVDDFFADQPVSSENSDIVEENTKKQSSFKNDVFEWLEIVVSAVVMLVILFTFVFKVVTINGNSMKNTLFNGQKLIISNINYTPKRGDIVVISKEANNNSDGLIDESIIKRVIATEGQVVDIDFQKGIVFVDGVALSEPYVRTPTNLSYDIQFPVVVKSGCVFVLGDNRNDSTDSRSSLIGDMGMIDTRYILGKALYRIFPFNTAGGIY